MLFEARDVSGSVVHSPVTIMAVPSAMVSGFALVGALALAASVFAIRRGGGLGWSFGILAALIALVGLGFALFAVWGRFAGLPWAFGGLS